MHLRISVPNNHQYKWRKNDHLSYTALSSAKTGLKLHYSSKHPVSAHSKVNHPFVCRNDHPLQLFITNSNRSKIKLLLFKIGTNSSFLQSKRNKVNTNSTILHFQIQKMTQLVWKLIWNLWQNFLLIKTMYSLRLFSIPIFKTLSGYTKSQFPWRMNMEIKANISSCLKF